MRNKMDNDNKEKKKVNWNVRPYMAMGLTALIVALCIITYIFILLRFDGLQTFHATFMKILHPIIFGFVIAYLINPIVKGIEGFLAKHWKKKFKTQRSKARTYRALGIIGAVVLLLAIIGILIGLVVPQLVTTIQGLIESLPVQVKNASVQIQIFLNNHASWASNINEWIDRGVSYAKDWLTDTLLPQTSTYLTEITTGIMSFLRVIINIIIGLIVAIYVLNEKERFKGQAKKIVYAIFKPKYGNNVLTGMRKCDEIFGGFIIGKLIDSLIIGLLTFMVLTIVNMPYAVLVSIIIGVTNIIPVFGPYIGAVPSFLLILLASPVKSIWFLIIIIIIQQIDGNIIGPKILGDSTGLSPFWVLFAIVVFGGLFGVVGMLFGVPIMGMVYYLATVIFNHLLKRKQLSLNTMEYTNLDYIDNEKHIVQKVEEEERTRLKRKKSNSILPKKGERFKSILHKDILKTEEQENKEHETQGRNEKEKKDK